MEAEFLELPDAAALALKVRECFITFDMYNGLPSVEAVLLQALHQARLSGAEAMRDELRKFTEHRPPCKARRNRSIRLATCTCGLAELLDPATVLEQGDKA